MTTDPVDILLVDDQPENLMALQALLEPMHQTLVAAGSGRDALRALLDRDFALILLDVQMPEMDGFETAALIREREASRTTPIIFLTAAHRTESMAFQGYSLGAVDYLFKPIVPQVLLSKVAVFVELARKTREIRRQVALLEERNAELAEAREKALQESRFKSSFLANMSHELRTPLNAIIGFAELMHDEKVGPVASAHKEFLGDILSSSRHLLQIINDVLDLAKVEAGRVEFKPEPVEIPRLLGEVSDVLASLSSAKRIQLQTEVGSDLGPICLDPARLKQVLYNYLSNALKFTPEGGTVWVRVGRETAPADSRLPTADSIRLEVQDSGIGIAPKDQGRLFSEFSQVASGATHRIQGTGLGLALTKRIVEAQGGRVGVESQPGHGSTFWAVLPTGGQRSAVEGDRRNGG